MRCAVPSGVCVCTVDVVQACETTDAAHQQSFASRAIWMSRLPLGRGALQRKRWSITLIVQPRQDFFLFE
jgi:hypothetical protein